MSDNPQTATLSANTVREFSFRGNYQSIEVCSVDGLEEVWFRTDGVDPVPGANGCYVLPACISAIEVSDSFDSPTVVKVISTGTPTVSVRGI